MRKKCLSLCLVLALAVSLCAVPAQAFDTAGPEQGVTVSAGDGYSAAIDGDGSLWMWGYNYYGQLGNGYTGNQEASYMDFRTEEPIPYYNQTVPQKIMDDVVSVATAGMTTGNTPHNYMAAAVKSDGSLWTWGFGCLGSEKAGDRTVFEWVRWEDVSIQTVPRKILDGVSSVSLGGTCNLALKTDGSLWVWGYVGGKTEPSDKNDFTGLEYVETPVKVMDGVISACAGPSCMAAIKSDGSLWLWGSDNMAGWGVGEYEYPGLQLSPTPEKVMDGVAAVSIGSEGGSPQGAVVAALKTDGSLWMWGGVSSRLWGISDDDFFYGTGTPRKVMDGVAALNIGVGGAAIKTDGSLWMWGYNLPGADSFARSDIPVKVMDGVAEVSVGQDHTIVRKTDGTIWAWGENFYGQIGNGGVGNVTEDEWNVYQTFPVQISGLNGGKTEPPAPTTYTVTVKADPAGGGSVTGGGSYDEDASVTVRAVANDGYEFAEWRENGTSVSTDASYTFTVKADRTLTAVFEPEQETITYTVTVRANPAGGGSVTGGGVYDEGASVTVRTKTNDGYEFMGWQENGKTVSISASYTFTIDRDVDLTAEFEQISGPDDGDPDGSDQSWTNPFPDVPDNAWYKEAVRFTVERGLMKGSGGKFNPSGTLTRGETFTMLARLDGADTSGGSVWYEKGMEWSRAKGVSDGRNPYGRITRQELAVMLYRYAGRPGADTSALNRYPDSSDIAAWTDFREAMAWAVETGIINGSGGKLIPSGTATRAEAAAMFQRYCEKLGV